MVVVGRVAVHINTYIWEGIYTLPPGSSIKAERVEVLVLVPGQPWEAWIRGEEPREAQRERREGYCYESPHGPSRLLMWSMWTSEEGCCPFTPTPVLPPHQVKQHAVRRSSLWRRGEDGVRHRRSYEGRHVDETKCVSLYKCFGSMVCFPACFIVLGRA